MSAIEQLSRDLPGLTADGHLILTVSLDLDPGDDGIPSARRVLKHALRQAEAPHALAHDARRSVDADEAAVEQSIDAAIAAGSRGLFYVGCAETGLRIELETPQPLRNTAALATRPALFELARYDYLERRAVTVVLTDLREMHAFRIQYGEVAVAAAVHRDLGEVRSSHGRTNTEGRVAGAGEGTAGGHSRSRIEKTILAHRTRFAADEAARLAELVGSDDILLVAGADEPRGELLKQLPDALARIAIPAPNIHPSLSEADIAELAMSLARDAQFAAADLEVDRWLAGDYRDRAVSGIAAARAAAERGQLSRLVLHEDAGTHFGTARDAREHQAPVDDAAVNDLVAAALTHGAEVLVARHPDLLERYEGVVGVTRW